MKQSPELLIKAHHPTCDLHIHTHYSDGRASPAEVVQHATSIGLTTIAITDHDTADGAREAGPIAARLGIALIPGIEFTTRWDDCDGPGGDVDIDVLGYFVDLDDAEFQAAEQAALEDIEARIADCCACLTAAGHPVTFDEVRAENARYAGALQLVLALQHNGQAKSWGEALALFEAHWSRERRSRLTIGQAIETIHAAGGVAVLAHPVSIDCGGWLQAEQLTELVALGLDGLEIYHPRLNAEAREHFLALAHRFDLLITGGSDEHGWPSGLPGLGGQPVTEKMVQALRAHTRLAPPAHLCYNLATGRSLSNAKIG